MSKEKQRIQPTEDGPFCVKNISVLMKSDGSTIETDDTIYLCRCGASSNKPFCDGSHNSSGFKGIREHDKPLDKVKSYEGKEIIIHDNRRICAHAAECVKNLQSVFNLKEKPWINPDGDSVESIIETIKKCPSGALSYTINNKKVDAFGQNASIEISKNGPYLVKGAIKIDDPVQPPVLEHYSLCRCGASRNKPYCDGSHHGIHFKAE